LVRRLGLFETFSIAAAVAALAALASVMSPNLQMTIAAQFVAGGCWGAASVAAYSAAVWFGRTGREGRFLGTLFAVLAIAAFARIAAYASDLVVEPQVRIWLPWLPEAAWALAALLLALAGRSSRPAR